MGLTFSAQMVRFQVVTAEPANWTACVPFDFTPITEQVPAVFCVKAWQIGSKNYVTTGVGNKFLILNENTFGGGISLYSGNAGRVTNPIAIMPDTVEKVSSAFFIESDKPMVYVDKSRPGGAFFKLPNGKPYYHVSAEGFLYYFQPAGEGEEGDSVTVAAQGAQGFALFDPSFIEM